jgi:hypothetical protein
MPKKKRVTWRKQIFQIKSGMIKVTVMRTARVRYVVQTFKAGKGKEKQLATNKAMAIDYALSQAMEAGVFPPAHYRRHQSRLALRNL